MSLFKSADIELTTTPVVEIKKASGVHFNGRTVFASSEKMQVIADTIKGLEKGSTCCYVTDGAWSNIELLEYLLAKSGPANVYFTTWAIAPEAISRFAAWHQELNIIDLYVLIDSGLNNRKPEVYQQATGVFKNLKTCKCHAKVTVIENNDHHLVMIGSANYTKNLRKEAGVIIWDKNVADHYISWILEEFNGLQ